MVPRRNDYSANKYPTEAGILFAQQNALEEWSLDAIQDFFVVLDEHEKNNESSVVYKSLNFDFSLYNYSESINGRSRAPLHCFIVHV